VVFAGEADEEHPATLIRSVRSLGAGREVIRVDPVAAERLRRAVLFVRSVGGRPSLTAKDAASAAIDQWSDAVADQYLGGDEFPADGGVPTLFGDDDDPDPPILRPWRTVLNSSCDAAS
jgi:hypothetical protein